MFCARLGLHVEKKTRGVMLSRLDDATHRATVSDEPQVKKGVIDLSRHRRPRIHAPCPGELWEKKGSR
jgi:hypothetical protein